MNDMKEVFIAEMKRLEASGPTWNVGVRLTPLSVWEKIDVERSFAGIFDMPEPDSAKASVEGPLIRNRIDEAVENLEVDAEVVGERTYFSALFELVWQLSLAENAVNADEKGERAGFALELYELFAEHTGEDTLDTQALAILSALLADMKRDATESYTIMAKYGSFIKLLEGRKAFDDDLTTALVLQLLRTEEMGTSVGLVAVQTGDSQSIELEVRKAAAGLFEIGRRLLTLAFDLPE